MKTNEWKIHKNNKGMIRLQVLMMNLTSQLAAIDRLEDWDGRNQSVHSVTLRIKILSFLQIMAHFGEQFFPYFDGCYKNK